MKIPGKGGEGLESIRTISGRLCLDGAFGHPATVLLKDGLILLVFYAGQSEECLSVHWVRVRL